MKTFSARETAWLQELDGIELANFWPRAIALLIDSILVGAFLSVTLTAITLTYIHFHPGGSININLSNAEHRLDAFANETSRTHGENIPHHEALNEVSKILTDIVMPVLYFGLFLWQGNGRTPGKRLMKIRVVSLVHTHISFWHAAERALGYGAALLEGGFGFAQFFLHPYRRCAQDRLAETIVVTERSYQQKFPARLGTPSEADTLPQ